MIRRLSRDRLAVLAALAAPLAVAAVLVPFRASIPNTDAALVMLLVVVAVAANGYRLAGNLAARSCHFQYGVAGVGRPARLRHDGSVTIGQRAWDVDAEGFPSGSDTELLAESGGLLQGRFLMTPAPGARPTLEQRLLAVALADQVGAALATSHPVDQS